MHCRHSGEHNLSIHSVVHVRAGLREVHQSQRLAFWRAPRGSPLHLMQSYFDDTLLSILSQYMSIRLQLLSKRSYSLQRE